MASQVVVSVMAMHLDLRAVRGKGDDVVPQCVGHICRIGAAEPGERLHMPDVILVRVHRAGGGEQMKRR